MTDLSIVTALANDNYIHARVAAAAALAGVADPMTWAFDHRWKIAAYGTIAATYEYAEGAKTINVNQNTGERTDTITDTVLSDAVAAIIAEEATPAAMRPAGEKQEATAKR